jgi:AraC-like DNA-binding protein
MHDDIKTYSIDQGSGTGGSFYLKKMEDIYDQTGGKPDRPHRHDYFTVVLVLEGEGTHTIDFKDYSLVRGTLFFIHPGQVHQVKATSRPKGFVLTFTSGFLLRNGISDQLINEVYLYNNYGESPPLLVDEEGITQYRLLIDNIQDVLNNPSGYSYEALGALLKLFLIQSVNHCAHTQQDNPQTLETGNRLMRGFKDLIDQHFHEHHKVQEYADLLSVTGDYLNKTVKSLSGKSAKDLIQNRLILEAKRTLLFTDVSNKEIAFQLGFEEPAHFSNFFKRHTSQSPSEFRAASRLS